MTLLERLADPNLLDKMTTGEKINASLQTTVLGMGITFGALLFIWVMTLVLARFVKAIENKGKEEIKVVETEKEETIYIEDDGEDEINEELVAVITAAIAGSLDTSIHNIVVRDIVRVNDSTPAWGQVGRINQVNSSL